ncbi:amidase [Aeromicrobium endophyticum]|uniref:Amidase n=1 Tax=Aeromicrobium endophyticum TaxID=2292704 RepID=A0A371PD02_9ACTN|nr:amidase [Aeromicrobium endophyticum]REK73792.1 amidase [Aeromicrobium endophyticum]
MKRGYFATRSITDVADGLRAGRCSSVQLVDRALHDAARWQPSINAFATIDVAGAREAALTADRELARGVDRGPLHGVPVAVKDMIDVRGLPTGAGSLHFAGRTASTDADCVSALREAGAIIVGKTTTHEVANGPTGDRSATGPTRNPSSVDRMAGGSSSGSAAAVAAGVVPAALGTDTGGSVRIPAAMCGVVGLRPSQSALSTAGVQPLAPSMDTVGLLARSAADARCLWEALTGRHPSPAPRRRPPRIGWISPGQVHPTDSSVERVARGAVRAWVVEEVTMPVAADLRAAYQVIQGREAHEVHAGRLSAAPELFDVEVRDRLRRGGRHTDAQLLEARTIRQDGRRALEALLDRFDFLALPTVPLRTPLVDAREVDVEGTVVDVPRALLALTSPWSMTGTPSLSLPAGTVEGLPVGVQLIARLGAEADLLSMGDILGER